MADTLATKPSRPHQINCHYINRTGKLQVVRIVNVLGWYFERVVFPGQRLVFETIPEAILEVHTSEIASSILSDRIPCERLRCETSKVASLLENVAA